MELDKVTPISKVLYEEKDGTRIEIPLATIGSTEKAVEISLPEVFATSKNIYDFQVNDDTVLISGDYGDIAKVGLWEYSLSKGTLTQVYESGNTFKSFQMVGENCLIVSGRSGGVLLYKPSDKTCTQLHSTFYNGSSVWFTQVGDNWLLTSSSTSGVFLYKPSTETMTQIWTTTTSWKYFYLIGDNCLISSDGNGTGILSYSLTDETLTQIYSEGAKFSVSQQVGDKLLIANTTTLLAYNSNDNTIQKLIETTYALTKFQPIGENCLVGGTTNTGNIFLYEKSTDTLKIVLEAFPLTFSFARGNNVLISSGSSSKLGIWLYNSETESMTQPYTTMYGWCYFHALSNGDCLISGTVSNSGLLLYKASDNTITQLYTSNRGWIYGQEIQNGDCLIGAGSDNNNGILRYKASDSTVKKFSSGYEFSHFQRIGNNWLITSDTHGGISLYNPETDLGTRLYTTGRFDKFTIDGDICILEAKEKSEGYSGLTVRYDNTTEKAALVGVYKVF